MVGGTPRLQCGRRSPVRRSSSLVPALWLAASATACAGSSWEEDAADVPSPGDDAVDAVDADVPVVDAPATDDGSILPDAVVLDDTPGSEDAVDVRDAREAEAGPCRGEPGTEYRTIDVRGTTRNYAVHAPPSYTGCEPTPLLVFFHGTDTGNVGDPRGNEEQYMLFTGLADHGDERGYLVAFPTAQAFSGTSGTALVWALPFLFPDDAVEADDAFTTALVDELERDYQVDAARVYIAGFSQGGFYVSHLFPNHSTEYAAFGMHGAVCSSTYECPGRPSRRIPGFVRIGSADEVVSEADANQFHEQLLGAGWRDGEDLDFEVVGGMGHTYNAGFNAAQWDFFSRFSL